MIFIRKHGFTTFTHSLNYALFEYELLNSKFYDCKFFNVENGPRENNSKMFLCCSSFFGANASHYASHSPTEAKSGYPYLGQLGGMDMGRVH